MWKTHKLIYQLCFCFSSWKTTFWGLPSAAPICTDNSQGLGHRCHPGILLSLSSWEFPLYLSCAVFSIWWIPYLPLNWFTLKFWFLFFFFQNFYVLFYSFQLPATIEKLRVFSLGKKKNIVVQQSCLKIWVFILLHLFLLVLAHNVLNIYVFDHLRLCVGQ